MNIVILAGGMGTRLREMTEFLPKALIPVGGIPIIVHIMRHYAHYGYRDFILSLGYKQGAFKEYFSHYNLINNDAYIATGTCGESSFAPPSSLDSWRIVLTDTGLNTFKGARLKRVEKHIMGDTFFCTYADAVADINLWKLLAFHKSHGRIATVTGIHPVPRFGEIHDDGGRVVSFSEKPDSTCLINGGYFVFNRGIFDYLTADEWCDLEVGPLGLLATMGELMVYEHKGFWGCMDTLKDVGILQNLWDEGKAPWRITE